jgi:hypothetical protein
MVSLDTIVFKKYYNDNHVDIFFHEMLRSHFDQTMIDFINYHTDEKLAYFMDEIFPPPSCMVEIWNAWDAKGRPVK